MIIAKNYNSAKLLTSLFRLRKVHKTYLAICHGVFKNKKGEIRGNLIKYENEKKISELAITNYNVISSNNFFSFLELKPITGRKHKLRKQLSFMGNPIVGDVKYNIINSKNNNETMLKCCSIKNKEHLDELENINDNLIIINTINKMNYKEMNGYKSKIQTFISKELNNYSIIVDVKLSEETDKKKFLNSKEKLEMIQENNESIISLIEEFNLRI